jgi:hypothetical protein
VSLELEVIEYALCETAKEPGHSVLKHSSTRAQ